MGSGGSGVISSQGGGRVGERECGLVELHCRPIYASTDDSRGCSGHPSHRTIRWRRFALPGRRASHVTERDRAQAEEGVLELRIVQARPGSEQDVRRARSRAQVRRSRWRTQDSRSPLVSMSIPVATIPHVLTGATAVCQLRRVRMSLLPSASLGNRIHKVTGEHGHRTCRKISNIFNILSTSSYSK